MKKNIILFLNNSRSKFLLFFIFSFLKNNKKQKKRELPAKAPHSFRHPAHDIKEVTSYHPLESLYKIPEKLKAFLCERKTLPSFFFLNEI
jgi:hypothetical protein